MYNDMNVACIGIGIEKKKSLVITKLMIMYR